MIPHGRLSGIWLGVLALVLVASSFAGEGLLQHAAGWQRVLAGFASALVALAFVQLGAAIQRHRRDRS